MEKENYKVYPYRWIVLIGYMLVTTAILIQWVAHASVARAAESYYAGQFNPASLYNIDLLASLYMIVYLIMCIPASYIIDRYGIRISLGIGSILTALAGMAKGIWIDIFLIQVILQFILAVAQPFILNAITSIAVRWFPIRERGLASGIATLAQYIGLIIGIGITPLMIVTDPSSVDYGHGFEKTFMVYGIASFAAGVLALIMIKEKPPTSPGPERLEHQSFFKGFAEIMKKRDMIFLLILFLIGLGIFNAIFSLMDPIAGNIGAKDSDGLIGIFMIIGGIIGAVVIPLLSDKFRKRKLFLIICVIIMIPGMCGLSFIKYINPHDYKWEVISAPQDLFSMIKDIPHPDYIVTANGEFVFDYTLSINGDVIDSRIVKYLAVDKGSAEYAAYRKGLTEGTPERFKAYDKVVVRNEKILMDGSPKDDGIIRIIYIFAIVSGFILGFSIMAAGPLAFQYAAEVTYPAAESISNGLLLLMGNFSGMIFVLAMSADNRIYLNSFMISFSLMMIVLLIATIFLKESPMIITEEDRIKEGE